METPFVCWQGPIRLPARSDAGPPSRHIQVKYNYRGKGNKSERHPVHIYVNIPGYRPEFYPVKLPHTWVRITIPYIFRSNQNEEQLLFLSDLFILRPERRRLGGIALPGYNRNINVLAEKAVVRREVTAKIACHKGMILLSRVGLQYPAIRKV